MPDHRIGFPIESVSAFFLFNLTSNCDSTFNGVFYSLFLFYCLRAAQAGPTGPLRAARRLQQQQKKSLLSDRRSAKKLTPRKIRNSGVRPGLTADPGGLKVTSEVRR